MEVQASSHLEGRSPSAIWTQNVRNTKAHTGKELQNVAKHCSWRAREKFSGHTELI